MLVLKTQLVYSALNQKQCPDAQGKDETMGQPTTLLSPYHSEPEAQTSSIVDLLESLRGNLLRKANRALIPSLRAKVGADDLVQETLVRALDSYHEFQGRTHSELLLWLTTILHHVLADYRRRYEMDKRDVTREEDDPRVLDVVPARDRTPSSWCRQLEDEEKLCQLLERLSPRCRLLLISRYWEGKTFTAIGRMLSLSGSGVRKLYERTLEELRHQYVMSEQETLPTP